MRRQEESVYIWCITDHCNLWVYGLWLKYLQLIAEFITRLRPDTHYVFKWVYLFSHHFSLLTLVAKWCKNAETWKRENPIFCNQDNQWKNDAKTRKHIKCVMGLSFFSFVRLKLVSFFNLLAFWGWNENKHRPY